MDHSPHHNWNQPDSLSACVRGVVAVVEDDPDVLDALGSWLELARVPSSLHGSGESLIKAIHHDGQQALIRSRVGSHLTRPLACVILDINLPGMNGLALATSLRGHFPHLALMLVTASGPEEFRQLGSLPPGVLCLQKPLDLGVLEEAVFKVLH